MHSNAFECRIPAISRVQVVLVCTESRSAKLGPRNDPRLTGPRLVKICHLLIQPLSFQSLPHSLAQWTTPNSFLLSPFHTHRYGGWGVPPFENLNHYFNSRFSAHLHPTSKRYPVLSFQSLTNCPFSIPFLLKFIHLRGVYPLRISRPRPHVRTFRPSDFRTPFPFHRQSHCGPTPLVPQLPLAQHFFALRGNNSALPGV
jgi:hypothetical protein